VHDNNKHIEHSQNQQQLIDSEIKLVEQHIWL
jgi:hypothetical protein